MTEVVASGLMRGCWRGSDGPLEGDTRPKGEKRPGLARPVRHRASALLYCTRLAPSSCRGTKRSITDSAHRNLKREDEPAFAGAADRDGGVFGHRRLRVRQGAEIQVIGAEIRGACAARVGMGVGGVGALVERGSRRVLLEATRRPANRRVVVSVRGSRGSWPRSPWRGSRARSGPCRRNGFSHREYRV